MGYVEIQDGVANRRIRIAELDGTVSIDVADEDGPTVSVPEDVAIVAPVE